MSLYGLLSKVLDSNEDILISVKNPNDITIFAKEERYYEPVLRIFPRGKTAEFLNIEKDWMELQPALEKKYENYPELKALTDYLNQEEYKIIWQ